jgi:hypothetical protein
MKMPLPIAVFVLQHSKSVVARHQLMSELITGLADRIHRSHIIMRRKFCVLKEL